MVALPAAVALDGIAPLAHTASRNNTHKFRERGVPDPQGKGFLEIGGKDYGSGFWEFCSQGR